MKTKSLLWLLWCLFALDTSSAFGQIIEPTTGIPFPVLGRVKARSAHEINSSPWSIGGETLDRDFGVFAHYKEYLGPLGAKKIRLQAGWAKVERKAGVYDWAWLDAVVDDARSQGVQPWLQLSYGNTIYPGGGDTGLGGGFPHSPEGLAAWDRWTRAAVIHFRDRVDEWEIWNEPDLNKTGATTADAYVDLYTRTAEILRGEQPRARLYALGLAHDLEYARKFLAGMKARERLDLVDAITVHTYPRNPDDTGNIDWLRQFINETGQKIEVRQGETGAPSAFQANFALSGISWTETLQTKWDLRRMLAHYAKSVPFNLFTICDLHYKRSDGALQMNYKGLLKTNPDQTVWYAKPSYKAAQVVFSVLDDSWELIPDDQFATTALRSIAYFRCRSKVDGANLAAYWFKDAPPSAANGVTIADFSLHTAPFNEPVLVDVRTGATYLIPADRMTGAENRVTFKAMPMYDSPMLIIERKALRLEE